MAETEKPFACSTTGCNMSFANEEHLNLHKKKHDMMLNLGSGSKSAGFMADQTPTPTRFIRNCEEVGLFQDLQNVNPFEETFRRAVEAGNTGTLGVPETGLSDDTLHTPHIFPHIADVLAANEQILPENPAEECSASITIAAKDMAEGSAIATEVSATIKLTETEEKDLIKHVKLATEKEVALAESIIETTSTEITSKIISEHISQLSTQLSINGEEVQLLLKTADGKVMQLSAIPIFEDRGTASDSSRPKQQTVVVKTEPPLICAAKPESKKSQISRLSLAKMKLKQVLTKSTGPQNVKPPETLGKEDSISFKKENRVKSSQDQVRKRDILERNRASSMRARAKRKAWIQQLERTVANVNETNVALQMEVKVLRAEVAKLKTILLAHKDCPVTRALQKGNGMALGPKAIKLNQEDAAPTASTRVGKRLSSETPIIPKKKVSLTSGKIPIIFPKIECTASVPIPNATLIKTVPTIKIMGVSHYITEKEDGKQIVIVQNTSRKLGEPPGRPIIQINPNYELDHASKSAGT